MGVDALDSTVCGACGLLVGKGRDDSYFHIEEPPDDWEPHDVERTTTRREYLYGQQDRKTPFERQADALEDIAASLRKIVERLYRA